MRFRITELPLEREIQLEEAFVREALTGIPGHSSLDAEVPPGNLTCAVEVTEEQDNVFVRGILRGWVSVACSRCLGPVQLPVSEALAVTFFPDSTAAGADEEVEIDENDPDVGKHDGKIVDVGTVVRDHLVLAVPYAPLCSDNCQGLCAQCGADLNAGKCGCPPIEDSRWSALKNLKLDRSN
jgi:uncharacterized protein